MRISSLLICLLFICAAQAKISTETELSSIQTGGNSTVETYNLKTLSKLAKEKSIFSFGGHYTLSASEQVNAEGDEEKVESARNWDANAKYEQTMSDSFSGFVGVIVEGDEFSGIKQRENVDLGGKYYFHKTDKTTSFTEVGARYSIERTTKRNEDGEDVFNYTKARLYYEIAHQKSESLSYKFWLEYIPNFTESEDYLVTYEPSVAVALSNMFSMKVAYKAVYDNVPNVEGNENTDYTFTTSLIAKF